MIAATLVAKSSSAPKASEGAPDSSVSPTTASGGAGSGDRHPRQGVSDASERTKAKAPATPVARAAVRSINFGLTRPATCVLTAATTSLACRLPTRYPMSTTNTAPTSTNPRL